MVESFIPWDTVAPVTAADKPPLFGPVARTSCLNFWGIMMFRRVLLAAFVSATLVSAASAATLHYSANLSGAREIPKTNSKGKGKFDASFDTQTKVLNYTLTFDGLSGPATAAHIHGPATRAQSAGVVAPLGDKSPTSPVTGSVTLTDDQAKALASSKLYVNVHTAANPAGEIRGQIAAKHVKRKASTAAKVPAAATAIPESK